MPGTDLSNVNVQPFSPRYYYTLQSNDGLTVTVLRDESPPKITGGSGGWEIVSRRRRKGLTSWVGREPVGMDLPILFDGWYDPPFSIDADKNTLRQMANGDDFVDPPTVTIEGNVPVTGMTWVISDLKWGDNVIWIMDDDGNDILVRQDCVISLLQYVQEDVVKVLNQKPAQETYRVKPGESLRDIAKKKYGNPNLWTLIRDANPNIRDPHNLAVTGTVEAPVGVALDHNCSTDIQNYNIGRYSWLNFKHRWEDHNCPGPLPQAREVTLVIPPKK